MEKGYFKVIKHENHIGTRSHTIIEDLKGESHKIPLILVIGSKIELEYEAQGSKLIFNLQPYNYENFLNGKYKVRVIRIEEKQLNLKKYKYFIVDFNNREIRVSFLNWQYSYTYNTPQYITITFIRKENNIIIHQSVDNNNHHPIFQVGQVYKFKVIGIESSSRVENGMLSVLGIDDIIYKIPSYKNFDFSEKKNKEISLLFKEYYENGNLRLEHTEKYFICLQDIFEDVLSLNDLKSLCELEYNNNTDYTDFEYQYNSKDNRWVLTLSKIFFTSLEIALSKLDYSKSEKITDNFLKLIKFTLSEHYLDLFKDDKRKKIAKIGELNLATILNLSEPISRLRALSYDSYLRELTNTITRDSFSTTICDTLTKAYNLLINSPYSYYTVKDIWQFYSKITTAIFPLSTDNIIRRLHSYLRSYIRDKENSIFKISFFNNAERKNHFYKNKNLISLLNLYKIASVISTKKNSSDQIIWQSKINKCVYLYLSDDIISTNLCTYTIACLEYNKPVQTEINHSTNLEYLESINASQYNIQIVKLESTPILNENQFEIKFHDEYATRVGYKTLFDGFDAVISKASMTDFEFGYYRLNNTTDNPKFEFLSHNNITNTLLIKYLKSTPLYINNNIQYTRDDVGRIIDGHVSNIRQKAAIVSLTENQIGYILRSDITFTPTLFINDILLPGKKYQFQITDIRENHTLKLNRKNFFFAKWKRFTRLKKQECRGVFLRIITLEDIIKNYQISIVNNSNNSAQTKCPKCKQENTLIIDYSDKTWTCYNDECNFNGKESYLFFVSDLNVFATAEIDSYNINYADKIKRGQYCEMTLLYNNNTNNIQANIVHFFDSYHPEYVFYEATEIEKHQNILLADLYEDLAVLSTSIDDEIRWLYWSQHYYSLTSNNKSYFYNIYIPYLKIINLFDKIDITNIAYSLKGIKEYAHTVINDESINETIIHFPTLKQHKQIIEIINQLGNDVNGNMEKDFISKLDQELSETTKEILRLTLSYNLLSKCLINENQNKILYIILDNIKTALSKGKITSSLMLDVSDGNTDKALNEFYALLNDNENQNLEFKSTLYTPIQTSDRIQKLQTLKSSLENEIDEKKKDGLKRRIGELETLGTSDDVVISAMKTIAAFANTNGGTLIIGVDDNKVVLGLESDYKSILEENKLDKFLLKFDSYIKSHLGEYVHSIISYKTWRVDDKDVFQVNVKPITETADPVILYSQKSQKHSLYIRAAGSTRELDIKEAIQYLKNKRAET